MSRAVEINAIIDEPRAMLDALRRFLDRREQKQAATVYELADAPPELARFAVGQTYGRYKERIIRTEVRTETGVPDWFDPRLTDGQFGTVLNNGWRCYIQVAIDEVARAAPSPFDEKIRTLVEFNPEQVSLFG